MVNIYNLFKKVCKYKLINNNLIVSKIIKILKIDVEGKK